MSATHAELIPIAWAAVVDAGKAMLTDSGSYQWSEDDDGMQSADAESLLDWVDDCEARLGADVANFRAAVLDFIAISTDGEGLDAADLESAVQNVKAHVSRGGTA
jgi:hypothetical protein